MLRKVEVVPHSPGWAAGFREVADRLRAVLGDEVIAVHHIGSTAIPGISAKPIIDVLLEAREVERLDDFVPEMARLGYEARGEFGIPGRRFFVKNARSRRTHHIHAFTTGSLGLERHLAFRDYMISHPEKAEAYSRLKERLAQQFPTDIEAYMDGKDPFIKEMERRAMAWSRAHDPPET
ncbi:MAG: GrpB family protein [Rubrobacter sp.]